jgi:hypothetical protein
VTALFLARAFLPVLATLMLLPATAKSACNPSAEPPADPAAEAISSHWPRERPLLIGEVHGTQEAPALVASLLGSQPCEQPVLLLLEIREDEQARLDAFMSSDGGAEARARLLSGGFWTRDEQDGRSSEAMFALVAEARRLKSQGRAIALGAFAPAGEGDGTPYSARMTRAFRAHLDHHPGHRVIGLVGNYHSQTVRTDDGPAETQPLGRQLAERQVLSIAVFARAGTHWSCSSNDSCGEKRIAGAPAPAEGPRLVMAANPDAARWHGKLMLDRFSTAGPAIGTR